MVTRHLRRAAWNSAYYDGDEDDRISPGGDIVMGNIVAAMHYMREFLCPGRSVDEMLARFAKMPDLDGYDWEDTPKRKSKDRRPLPQRVRWEVFSRDRYRCVTCGRKPPDVCLHVDHITAVCNGGSDHESNLRTLCEDCNQGKGGS